MDRSGGSGTDMNDRRPALKFVVVIMMKKIRNADGQAGGTRFDGGKGGVIVD
jgi:hypothetical protein